MPGLYRAKVSGPVSLGRAGLALPFTPTNGPIFFTKDHTCFRVSPMVQNFSDPKAPWTGSAEQLKGGGIKTYHMDDCVTVCVAELEGVAGYGATWGRTFFAHLAGGRWNWCDSDKAFDKFAKKVDGSQCYSLVIANHTAGVGSTIQEILNQGFPVEKMSVYITNMKTTSVAVDFKNYGQFGLIDWSGGRYDEDCQGLDQRGIKSCFKLG